MIMPGSGEVPLHEHLGQAHQELAVLYSIGGTPMKPSSGTGCCAKARRASRNPSARRRWPTRVRDVLDRRAANTD